MTYDYPDTRGHFGPYGGQILLPDVAGTRINRLMLEKVDGQYQGACTHFFNGNGLGSGNNRVVFSPDQRTLYVGQTMRGWGKLAEGLQRISWQGTSPFDVKTMSLTKKGFRLQFTRSVAKQGGEFKLKTYHYEDNSGYGGPKLGVTEVKPTNIRRTSVRTIEFDVPGLKSGGQVYELQLDLRDVDGNKLWANTFCYTVNRMRAD